MGPKVAVIVSTFESPLALDAVLRGLSIQTDRQFEVVIADDGSGEETARLIRHWQAHFPVALRHVRHEHRGFRAAEIRNRGVAATETPYLLFLDGDCVPFPHFVRRHRHLAQPGWFVSGNRILLKRAATDRMLASGEAASQWSAARFVALRWRRQINHIGPLLPLPMQWWRRLQPRKVRGVKSCNLGVWRSDFLRIDGFDMSFVGWGGEDKDLGVRLIRSGVRRKEGRQATTVLHLWHPARGADGDGQRERPPRAANPARTTAVRGLSQLQGAPTPDR